MRTRCLNARLVWLNERTNAPLRWNLQPTAAAGGSIGGNYLKNKNGFVNFHSFQFLGAEDSPVLAS
jgi:hypothetical protein